MFEFIASFKIFKDFHILNIRTVPIDVVVQQCLGNFEMCVKWIKYVVDLQIIEKYTIFIDFRQRNANCAKYLNDNLTLVNTESKFIN